MKFVNRCVKQQNLETPSLPFDFSVNRSRRSDVSGNIRILGTKLAIPHTDGTIKRERLLSLLEQSGTKKLTTIVAGPGYGKTTLVAHAIACLKMKTVWYRLDESDGDPATFFNYLVAGMRRHYPHFGTATLQSFRETTDPSSAVATIFLSETEDTIKEDIIIVLDDCHSVKGREIGEVIRKILRDLSPFIHLILISRSEPDLPLSRLRAIRAVIDIREEDIAFSAGETERLYAEVFGLSLSRSDIDNVCHKIGGWISGLILLCHSLKGKQHNEIEQNLLHLRGSQRAIFGYLEENIFGSLAPEQQRFLLKTSILFRITAKFCDRLLNINYSLNVLRYLEDNHLFVASVDEAGQRYYSYHQLFRDFLQNKLRDESDHESVLRLHLDAAELSEKSGDKDEAVRHYLMAEEFGRVCGILNHVGKRLFAEGRFHLLSSYLDKIPSDILNDYPGLRYLQGQLAGLRGKHRQATGYYDLALKSFFEPKDIKGVQSCLIELGLISFQTGNLKEAEKRFVDLLEQNHLEFRLRIEVLGYLIYISAFFRNMDLADKYFDEAIALINSANGASDNQNLRSTCLKWIYSYGGYRHAFSGEFAKVLEAVAYTKAISENSQPDECSPVVFVLESMAYYGLQRYSEGFEAARQALRLLKKISEKSVSGWHSPRLSLSGRRGFSDSSIAWVLAYSACCAVELGKINEAIEDAEESLKSFRKTNCLLGEGFAYSVLYKVHLKSGNLEDAENWARIGLKMVRGLTMPRMEMRLILDLAAILTEKRQFAEALKLLAEADEGIGCDNDAVRIGLLYARLYRAIDHNEEGSKRLLAALEICERHRLDPLLFSEEDWLRPLLTDVVAEGKILEFINEIINKMKDTGKGRTVLLQNSSKANSSGLPIEMGKTSPPGLQICLFGKFRVLIDGIEIPERRWKSRKAKTLFQFLAHSRPRGGINKEVLMELLWPEENPELTVKRFHVALASLRKTLQPDIVKGVPSSYIVRVGDSYRIEVGEYGWVDTETFASELRHAGEEVDPERALAHYVNADSLYVGDFLKEEVYSDWCSLTREKTKDAYLSVIRRIIAYHEHRGNLKECIEYAEKYLEVDGYAEDIYRLLMIFYWKIGDKFRMTRTFKLCKEKIESELNCRLSKETEQLFRKSVSSLYLTPSQPVR
jgi:LuxR family transcriptional regulator, maltose regulon positive regulatory protein